MCRVAIDGASGAASTTQTATAEVKAAGSPGGSNPLQPLTAPDEPARKLERGSVHLGRSASWIAEESERSRHGLDFA